MGIWWVVSVARDRPGAERIGGRSLGRAGEPKAGEPRAGEPRVGELRAGEPREQVGEARGGREGGRVGARGTAPGRQREDEANVGEGELQDTGASAPKETSEMPWRPFFGTLRKWGSFERFGCLKVACSGLGGHRICGKHFLLILNPFFN